MQVLYHLDENDNVVGKTVDEEYISAKGGFRRSMEFLLWVFLFAVGGFAVLAICIYLLGVALYNM